MQITLDIIRCSQGIVEVFSQEGQAETAGHTNNPADR
jgi:hypothetical protein